MMEAMRAAAADGLAPGVPGQELLPAGLIL
jgi:hypothetical protein